MRISLEWLREYADLDAPIDVLVRALVDTGTEVDRVERTAEGVIVARVIAVRPVPESTRGVQFAEIEVGAEAPIRLLTAAPNIRVGDLVAYAPPGTRLPGSTEPLGVRRMLGYDSPGMLCSAVELAIGDDADGILVLERGRPGQPAHEVLDLDVVFEVEVTTNRPDCLCHLGIARELAAALHEPLRPPRDEIAEPLLSAASATQRVRLRIDDATGCPRFTARVIENVAVGPSPDWLQRRLRAIGSRPINNVVDITNYVAHELGQPLHAFDLDRFTDAGGGGRPATVVVRRAKPGERLLCLDEVERSLDAEDLVVCSGAVAAGLAGVIGGQVTAVEEGTRNVLLEAANWEPASIRATSRRLGVRTDASSLNEKGLSDELPPIALERAAALIAEIAGGHVLRERLDEHPAPLPPPAPVQVTAEWLSGLLGFTVDAHEAATALAHLGFAVEEDGGRLRVQPPYFRRDVGLPEDVAEEVGRSLGYDRAPSTLPGRRYPVTHLAAEAPVEERVRDVCIGAGYDEVLPYVFTQPQVAAWLPGLGEARHPIPLRNPLSDEMTHLRTSLMPGLCQVLATNLNRGVVGASIFELGRVYWDGERRGQPPGATPDHADDALPPLPAEPLLLGAAVHLGDGGGAAADAALRNSQALIDWVVRDLSGDTAIAEPGAIAGLRPGRSAWLQGRNGRVGVIGELDIEALSRFELRGRVVVAELRVDAVLPSQPRRVQYRPVPRFPAVIQDLAVGVDAERLAGQALAVIREAGGHLLESVELYDEFRGAQVGEGRKGWTFRLTFRSPERTLTSDEVQRWQEAIALGLRQRCGAEVRR